MGLVYTLEKASIRLLINPILLVTCPEEKQAETELFRDLT